LQVIEDVDYDDPDQESGPQGMPQNAIPWIWLRVAHAWSKIILYRRAIPCWSCVLAFVQVRGRLRIIEKLADV